jgi:hypothetical protein
MSYFAAPPTPDDRPFANASIPLRWEDVAQDGRIMLTALAPAIGWTIWNGLLRSEPGIAEAGRKGLVAILSRITADGTDEPIRVVSPVHARGTYELVHSVDERGEVDRLFLNAWVEVKGRRGRMYPPESGPEVPAGKIFVEHTFTRLFGPPAERRVQRLDIPGLPPVPPTRYAAPGFASAMEIPAGATALDEQYVPDGTMTCFGLEHTDSNQHVNSLVYPRLFAEAALRRLDAMGRSRAVLVRSLDIAYRKPSFAGDRVQVHLKMFEANGKVGAAGYLAAEGEPRPRVCARILLA